MSQSREPYTTWECFTKNYIFFFMGLLGLNWTHYDQYPMSEFQFIGDVIRRWPLYLWIMFGMIFFFVLFNVLVVAESLYISGAHWIVIL